MAIFDTMQFIRPDVSTLCIGMAASMGAFLLAAGAKGKRFALPNSTVLIHQPLGRLPGPGVGHREPRAIRHRPEAPVHRPDGADSPDARSSRSSATTTVTISSPPTRPWSTESSTRSCRSGPRAGKVAPRDLVQTPRSTHRFARLMADKSTGDKLLYCSFCGKSQHEVRKLIAGPSVFICDECIELCNDIIREEGTTAESARTDKNKLPTPHEIRAHPRPVRDRPGPREEDPVGRRLQPLQAAGDRRQGRRGRARQEQHPADRPDRLGQDAARADARAAARRAVRDRRRDDADRGGLRRRGRREHHPEAAAEVRLRHREGAARHRLHRRDRQDLAQERQPVDHARRLGRGRAAGAAQADRGHDRLGAAAGRPQAPEPGVRAGRHDQHPVRLRRRVRRPREDHPPAHGEDRHRLRRRGARARTTARTSARCCASASPRT